ncbi:MAG: NmrA family transcriptional regulator [Nocardioidaceae bacterium]|nr:NmrA family transcriptional regulator [Nocardioidaceae bacterium]
MKIAVTGATGQLGRLVTDLLLASADRADLVLITRDPAKLADLAATGVDVRAGDFDRPETLAAAFAGVDRLLLISTDSVGTRLAGHYNAIDAAKAAGVTQVVYTSLPNPVDANPAGVVQDHKLTEEHLRASGLAWTMLRNNLYTDMQVGSVQAAIASGQHVSNTGTGGSAYVTRADCAAVAAAVLTGEGHEGKAYDVTGPSVVTAADLAALASDLGDKPVTVVDVDDATYVAGLVEHAGLPQAVAELLASFGAAARDGFLAPASDVVERLTGTAPTSLRTVVASAL